MLTAIWLSLCIGLVLLGHDLREIRKSLRDIAESLRNMERAVPRNEVQGLDSQSGTKLDESSHVPVIAPGMVEFAPGHFTRLGTEPATATDIEHAVDEAVRTVGSTAMSKMGMLMKQAKGNLQRLGKRFEG